MVRYSPGSFRVEEIKEQTAQYEAFKVYADPEDTDSELIAGDALHVLRTFRGGVFRCCVTSPPYWGLRDYGIPGQIGAEEQLADYVEELVAVFAEVRRVLADDGTLWLNLGDSYTSGNRTWRDTDKKNPARAMSYRPPTPEGLKPKDLIGVPWRVALALQADGWYLRSEIIWHKPNCQPESVKDRPTLAHEHIFMLSKSERYYYDHEAIKEPANGSGRLPQPPQRLEHQHRPLPGRALRHVPSRPRGALHPCRQPEGRHRPGPVHRFRHDGHGGPTAGTAVRGDRTQPGIRGHRPRTPRVGKEGKCPLVRRVFPVLSPDLQVAFYYILGSLRKECLAEALRETVAGLRVAEIDRELERCVPPAALQKVASFGLRGEVVFPVPLVLRANPSLLGYYRLLFGLSQKEFYNKGPFGRFKGLEESGQNPPRTDGQLEALCRSLIETAARLVDGLDDLSLPIVHELQLLTLGPQLRGGRTPGSGRRPPMPSSAS